MKQSVPVNIATASWVVLCACALSVSRAEDPPGDERLAKLESVRKALAPLATKLLEPKPGAGFV